MDTVIDNVEEFEQKLNIEVEKNFSIDIDTILAAEYKHLPVAARMAHDKYTKLLWRAYAGKGKWRAGAWGAIEAAIEDEGLFAYDLTDVTTVCTYTLFIEVAFLYLRDGLKKDRYQRLSEVVKEDVSLLERYISSECDDLSESDQHMIYYALTMCRLYMQRLEKIYPDT